MTTKTLVYTASWEVERVEPVSIVSIVSKFFKLIKMLTDMERVWNLVEHISELI